MKTSLPALPGYAWLLSLLLICASSPPPMKYPFPITLAYSQSEIPKRFGVVTVEQDPDLAIHYKLVMPLQWGQVKGTRRLVTPAHPFELRSHFRALQPPLAEAKVSVAYVAQEVASSDWLSLYLRGLHERVLHERHVPQRGGAIPDVLTISGAPGHERVSRWLVLKDHAQGGGAHFFLIQASTDASNYTADMANVFFVIISNFDLLHPIGWVHAEQLRTLARSVPVPFTTACPLSWQLVENPASDDHFYQCKFIKSIGDQPVGRLGLTLVQGQSEADLRRLVQEDQAGFAELGLQFGPAELAAGVPIGPLQEVLVATSPQTAEAPDQVAYERHVVLGRFGPQSWVYADRLAPTRQSAPEPWAISKQAFDIMLEHLQIG
jgi:hypothetical protein